MEVGAYNDGFCDSLATDIERHEAVWVIVDQLTKSAHFLVVRMTFTGCANDLHTGGIL